MQPDQERTDFPEHSTTPASDDAVGNERASRDLLEGRAGGTEGGGESMATDRVHAPASSVNNGSGVGESTSTSAGSDDTPKPKGCDAFAITAQTYL